MTTSGAVDLLQNALWVCVVVAAPMLITALVVGVLISLAQAVTQIQEQTLTFVPKLLLVAFVFLLSLPWIVDRLVAHLVGVFRSLPAMAA